MWQKYSSWIFVAAITLLPMGVFAIVKWYEHSFVKLPVLGPEKHTIANFSLQNQHRNTVTLSNWDDKIVVANFFFTHCPVVCPKMTNNLKRVQAYADVKDLHIASFSVDPERDSAQQLQSFIKKFSVKDDNWDFITGDKKELYKLARKSFLIVATDGDGGETDFIHSESLVLIDKQKRIRGYYNGTKEDEVNQLVKDIKKLSKED